jgi:hypothetical protein
MIKKELSGTIKKVFITILPEEVTGKLTGHKN